LTKEFVKNSDIDEVVEDVYYQLDNTIDEWYDNKTSCHSMFFFVNIKTFQNSIDFLLEMCYNKIGKSFYALQL
jgi:hypothetical protein